MNNSIPLSLCSRSSIIVLALSISLTSCSKDDQTDISSSSEQRGTLITTTQAILSNIEVIEESIGYLETKTAPIVSAEVAGRVINVAVDTGQTVTRGQRLARIDAKDFKLEQDAAESEVKRVDALIRGQQKQVERYEVMVKENFVTESLLDEASAQLDALNEQLAGARARLKTAQRNLGKAEINSPTSGHVEQRLISAGDFVKIGAPLFHITRSTTLQAHLPFPENIAAQLETGLKVRLSSPMNPDKVIEGRINEIRPTVGRANKALKVIVELDNPGNWKTGGSVRGDVIVTERQQSVMISEISVVRRPAGSVAYVIEDNTAQQKVITLGVHRDGLVEILSGLSGTETLAKDGAAYLTDGAPVKISEEH